MEGKVLTGEPMILSETGLIEDMIQSCTQRSDDIYMVDANNGQDITFGKFLANAGSVSYFLRALRQKAGHVITVVSDCSIDSLTFVFGTWISGAAVSCINPSLMSDEIVEFLKICQSQVVYCGEQYLDKVQKSVDELDWMPTIISPNAKRPYVDFYSCFNYDSEKGLNLEYFWTGKDHGLSIMFTSGTTGKPKGVVLRDQAMKCNASMAVNWTENSRVFFTSPLYWISNAICLSLSATVGSVLIIAAKMSTEQLFKAITTYKPTEWFTGPSVLIDMCHHENVDDYDTSSFNKVSVGGSILLPQQRRLITEKLLGNRNRVHILYGSTEAGMVSYDQTDVDMHSPQYASIGKVGNGVLLKVVDVETGKIQPPLKPGEICAKSFSVLKKYFNKDITEEELDKDGYWHMGDLGFYDNEGYVYFLSRLKDVMKYRGQQIAPAELEMVIQKFPGVIECCVVGKSSLEEGGDLPTAFVVRRPDSTFTEQELYDFVADNVIDEKKLRGGIYFVSSLPKSPVGKILRNVLQKRINS